MIEKTFAFLKDGEVVEVATISGANNFCCYYNADEYRRENGYDKFRDA